MGNDSRKEDESRAGGRELSRSEFLRLAGIGAGITIAPGFLASCDAFVGGGGGGASGTLSMAVQPDERAPIEAMIEAYKEQNPDVEFNTQFVESNNLHTQLQTQLSSGTAPDFFRVAPGSGAPTAVGQVVPQGYIADLSDQPWADDIPEQIQPLCQVDGNTYILPATRAIIGTYYNENVFNELDLEAPTTWEEFLALCDTIRQGGRIPYALGIGEAAVTQFLSYSLVASTVYGNDNPNFDEDLQAGRTTFAESEGWREALEKMLELNERGYYNDNPNGTSYEQSLQMVATGEAAMLNLVSASLPLLQEYAGDTGFGAFATPGVDDPANVWLPASPINTYGVNADGENLEGAKDFISFMGEQENVNRFAEIAASLPGLATVEGADIPPILESMVSYLEEGKNVPFMNHLWPNAGVQQVFMPFVQELFAGEATIEDGLQRLDRAYQQG